MDNKEFKRLFNNISKENEFESIFGGWFKESKECIIVLDLQKSKFGNYYDLNIKAFVNGIFHVEHIKSKDLVSKEIGNIFLRQPNHYNDILNLELPMSSENRKEKLEYFFNDFIIPVTTSLLSLKGIRSLYEQGIIRLLPAIREKLYNDLSFK